MLFLTYHRALRSRFGQFFVYLKCYLKQTKNENTFKSLGDLTNKVIKFTCSLKRALGDQLYRCQVKQERFWLQEIKLRPQIFLHWIGGSFYETAVRNQASFYTLVSIKKNDFVVLLLSWMSCYCYSGHFFLKQPRKILSRFLHNQATSFFSCRYRNAFFSRRNKLFNHENWMAVR